MRHFAIQFHHPWLLLLLVPAFALTFFLYFRLNKRFRKTRNRIISIVLHSIVMVLCISVLAGIEFTYQLTNLENEIILLVDVSETEEESAAQRDDFVRTLIEEGGYNGYKMGVVTFGFTQQYVAPLSYETEGMFEAYKNAPLPDTTATNLSAALKFAGGLFTDPEQAKIVLISDGKETDELAAQAVGPIAKKGIKVDTVFFDSVFEEDSVQVVGVSYPTYHVNQNEQFTLEVALQCRRPAPNTTVQIYDNGRPVENTAQSGDSSQGQGGSSQGQDKSDTPVTEGMRTVNLEAGYQTVAFRLFFAEQGLHEITVKVTCNDFEKNNAFCSYYYLEVFGKVLVIEHTAGESEALASMLEEEEIYAENVEILNLSSYEKLPTTVDDLRMYDQIILNNIANSDLSDLPVPETADKEDGQDWFVELLYSYVYDYGGGLLTVGGTEPGAEAGETKAHAYNKEDMYNTRFQEILPVQAIDYTPPVGVMVIIDVSGSMGTDKNDRNSPLYWAIQGAYGCLEALSTETDSPGRNFMGIMTLDTSYGSILPLTSCAEYTRIRNAIYSIIPGGGTVYSDAIKAAGESLRRLANVDKRHIILVSDGEPSQDDIEIYEQVAKELYATSKITLSLVGANMQQGSESYNRMKSLTDQCGGQTYTATGDELIDAMRDDLRSPALQEVNREDFYPVASNVLSPLFNGIELEYDQNNMLGPKLSGFFGVKKRDGAELVLEGEYGVPIYAQWKFGKGTVGSFMCDLNGSESSWAREFFTDDSGKRFLFNVVANLMPTEDISPKDIRLDLKEENYINKLDVFTSVDEKNGEYLEGKFIEITAQGEIEHPLLFTEGETWGDDDIYITSYLRGNHCEFVVKRSGLYRIVIEKHAADGTLLGVPVSIYKSFSYSTEYDTFLEEGEEDDAEVLMAQIADRGNGKVVPPDDPWSIVNGKEDVLSRSYDPRLAFIITAMVLFLLDIAVRKFKFKWIHELVREHREKKAEGRA